MKNESKGWRGILLTAFLTVLAVFFLIPVFLVLMNSLKGQFYISDAPFALPNAETFVGFRNYWNGIEKVDFFSAFGYSAFITLFFGGGHRAVYCHDRLVSGAGWDTSGKRALLPVCFQHDRSVSNGHVHHVEDGKPLHLDNPVGIILLYLGFGSGLSVFFIQRVYQVHPIGCGGGGHD